MMLNRKNRIGLTYSRINRHIFLVLGMVILVCISSTAVHSQSMTINENWKSAMSKYNDVHYRNNVAYFAAGQEGLEIVDFSNPAAPVLLSRYEFVTDALKVHAKGTIACLIDRQYGLMIFDVSNVRSPKLTYTYLPIRDYYYSDMDVYARGDYAYLSVSGVGLMVFDISNPKSPIMVGAFADTEMTATFFVQDNYAYVVKMGYYYDNQQAKSSSRSAKNRRRGDKSEVNAYFDTRLSVIDISTPAFMQELGHYDVLGDEIKNVFVKNGYGYLATSYSGMEIVDLSNKSNPVNVTKVDNGYSTQAVSGKDNYVFLLAGTAGLRVYDVSKPSAPVEVKVFQPASFPRQLCIANDVLFITEDNTGVELVDVSKPAHPSNISTWSNNGPHDALKVMVDNNRAFVLSRGANYGGKYFYEIQTYDLSNPAMPKLSGVFSEDWNANDFCVSGNVLGIISKQNNAIKFFDVSNPAALKEIGQYQSGGIFYSAILTGNTLYLTEGNTFKIIDISNPAAPVVTGSYQHAGPNDYDGFHYIAIADHYAYISQSNVGVLIVDFSNASAPHLVDTVSMSSPYNLYVNDNRLYLLGFVNEQFTLQIYNITSRENPALMGSYVPKENNNLIKLTFQGNYLFGTTSEGLLALDVNNPASPQELCFYSKYYLNSGSLASVPDHIFLAEKSFYSYSYQPANNKPVMALDKEQLSFTVESPAYATNLTQTFNILNYGGGTMSWETEGTSTWCKVSPKSGRDNRQVTVSVNPVGLQPGTYSDTITVTEKSGNNGPLTLKVTLQVNDSPSTSIPPFGAFDSPTNGATVDGSIPVTGWALDNMGIQAVEIFVENGGGLLRIGTAVMVEGARPDVEAAYPNYPNNNRAGWGYMLLTHFLPGGDGTFTLHAVATDMEGNQTDLGTKTITVDNGSATRPFGALDYPAQGETVSGNQYTNFGWALTPYPGTIRTDGSTIWVAIDGKEKGHPVYNQYRKDIAQYFPGYNNSEGAGGHYIIDTMQLEDGIHTIQWTVTDNRGITDGIGSRFFTVDNQSSPQRGTERNRTFDGKTVRLENIPVLQSEMVEVKRGYGDRRTFVPETADEDGRIEMTAGLCERMVIRFGNLEPEQGYTQTAAGLRPLPVGSFLDVKDKTFYWQPGPGFAGKFSLVFSGKQQDGGIGRITVVVHLTQQNEPGSKEMSLPVTPLAKTR